MAKEYKGRTIIFPKHLKEKELSANVYMNEADQYIKRELKVKYYVRYMDDLILIIDGKKRAQEILAELLYYIEDTLNLKVNRKKTKIFPLSQGVNSIGFKIRPDYKLLRNDSKEKIKRKLKAFDKDIYHQKIPLAKKKQIIASWEGHARFGDSYNFLQTLCLRYKTYDTLTSSITL